MNRSFHYKDTTLAPHCACAAIPETAGRGIRDARRSARESTKSSFLFSLESLRVLCVFVVPLLLAACASASLAPTPAPTPDQSAEWTAWQSGPHASTYDLGKGPNTYCARCHSPRNWDPASRVDDPPNCVSCKFDFEPGPRLAEHNVLVSRSEWLSIRCDQCHRVTNGIAEAEVVWWDQAAGAYEPIVKSTTLCEKCHADTETLRHQRALGAAAHASYTCTQCHDPHSAAATCDQAGCHTGNRQIALTLPATAQANHPEGNPATCAGAGCHGVATAVAKGEALTHGGLHAKVNCAACHDASGLEVGPLEDGSVWVTWRTTELLGQTNREPYASHALQRTVDCARCHYPDNPWNLLAPVESSAP